jgi:hypothetical protein
MLRLNLTSAFLTCRAVVPAMIEAGYGRIVNISRHDSCPAYRAIWTCPSAINSTSRAGGFRHDALGLQGYSDIGAVRPLIDRQR